MGREPGKPIYRGPDVTRRRGELRVASMERWFVRAAIASLLAVVSLVCLAMLHRQEKPRLQVYMDADCDACRAWVAELETRGFDVTLDSHAERAALRARLGVPARFAGAATTIYRQLFIEGLVPAADIHRLIRMPSTPGARGLVLAEARPDAQAGAGAPREPFTVYAVGEYGLLRPFAVHDLSERP